MNVPWERRIKRYFGITLLAFALVILFSSLVFGFQTAKQPVSAAFLVEKYPFFYRNPGSLSYDGIEAKLLDWLGREKNYDVTLTKFEQGKSYDIVIGGAVKSDFSLAYFKDYNFVRYFTDTVSIYVRGGDKRDFSTFLKSKHEKIGIWLYSYAYFLLKDMYPDCKLYSYEEDLFVDLRNGIVDFVIVDDYFSSELSRRSNEITKIRELYREETGVFVTLAKPDLVQEVGSFLKDIKRGEIFTW